MSNLVVLLSENLLRHSCFPNWFCHLPFDILYEILNLIVVSVFTEKCCSTTIFIVVHIVFYLIFITDYFISAIFLAFSSKGNFWLSTEILNFGSENERKFENLCHFVQLCQAFSAWRTPGIKNICFSFPKMYVGLKCINLNSWQESEAG